VPHIGPGLQAIGNGYQPHCTIQGNLFYIPRAKPETIDKEFGEIGCLAYSPAYSVP
jgi:hypothetical protein